MSFAPTPRGRRSSLVVRLAVAAGGTGIAGAALAHHPTGGEVPATLLDGLLSGIGHPVIGVDHLAFLIAAALLVAWTGRADRAGAVGLAIVFALAGALGTLLRGPLPEIAGVEWVVAASLIAVGAFLLAGRTPGRGASIAAVAVAGIAHGYAFGEAVIGAEATPIAAYLIGLAAMQATLLATAYLAGRWLLAAAPARVPSSMRIAGLAVAAVGLAAASGSLPV